MVSQQDYYYHCKPGVLVQRLTQSVKPAAISARNKKKIIVKVGTMTIKNSVAIAWCDNGMVDGKFMQGVTDVMLKSGVKFCFNSTKSRQSDC
jgi:hypothetical protein